MKRIILWLKKATSLYLIAGFIFGALSMLAFYRTFLDRPEVEIIVIRVPKMEDEIKFMNEVSRLLNIMMDDYDKSLKWNKKIHTKSMNSIKHPKED